MKLTDEIAEGESYGLEFKLIPNEERIKYLKTAVAFANGKGGRLLFGVANDGTVHGIARDKVFSEMDAIVNSISDACSPRVPIDIGIENIDGKQVIVVDVLAGTRCPYFIKSEGDKDGVYVRVGATTQRAVAGYSKIRNEVLAKALNYMRFIEEWGSGLKRVNEELGEYGIGKVSVDDTGFAVRMNVYRNQVRGGETVNPKNASKKRTGATVNATVSDMIVEIVRANPGIRRPRLLELLPTIKRGTLTRRLSDLSSVIEFRGAPKTGGYYCK